MSPAGPITPRDVFYGLGRQIEASDVDFFAHKTGFSPSTLQDFLQQAGFAQIFVQPVEQAFEVHALAFKKPPTSAQRRLVGLPS